MIQLTLFVFNPNMLLLTLVKIVQLFGLYGAIMRQYSLLILEGFHSYLGEHSLLFEVIEGVQQHDSLKTFIMSFCTLRVEQKNLGLCSWVSYTLVRCSLMVLRHCTVSLSVIE